MAVRQGKYTVMIEKPVSIVKSAATGSKKESEGPLADNFDIINTQSEFGESSWEKAECTMQKKTVEKALQKAGYKESDIDFIFAGDLLNQCISSTYGLRDLGIPFVGLYGACSTMAESIGVSSVFIDSGAAKRCAAVTSSHFCSAERQFRFPLGYGGQRTPTSQWTATASGAAILEEKDAPPYIRAVTFGTIEDLGIKDANNMGAAMAPAAAKTIKHFFEDTNTTIDDYDMLFTGDLGKVGSQLLCELLKREGIDLKNKYRDCGLMLYDIDTQDVHSGGSGCGCSASVLCGTILPQMSKKKLNNILFVATGALMSTTSVQQGESIPSIAHLVYISNTKAQEHGKSERKND